jgi:hypothetical protein
MLGSTFSVSTAQNSYQLVLPQVHIPQILKLYHESPLAGHIGIQQTIDNLGEQRYFSRLPSIVSDFVSRLRLSRVE